MTEAYGIALIVAATAIVSALAGWMFGTWQCRIRWKSNVSRMWNERCTYGRYWNPWNEPDHRHLLFTEHELRSPSERAERNPEDRRIPR